MKILDELFYTENHEWIRQENGEIVEGITDYAQSELSDIVYIELPEEGVEVHKGEAIGTIEAVKTVSDLYTALSGKIVEVNRELEDHPDLINKDPYDAGWIVRIKISDPEELKDLLDAEEYKGIIEREE
ncbi:MAG: glycine cleavage system protein GcvH [Candidatus Stahlbacteria bacterium]|jgi:glycine cleavage system H protein|nr:glycine cleavage system protein GcvH [candidate division WOR-3 bacterium]TEU01125.1 MAG: glycine cleavage system protein GcvH [Candidatus Stahlbacteria bacterium]